MSGPRKIRRRTGRLPQPMRLLLKRYGHRIRARDIAQIVGCSGASAEKFRRRYGGPSRSGPRLSLATVRRLAVQLARGLRPDAIDLQLTYSARRMDGERWEEWQLAELRCSIGRRPLAAIARDIGRSRHGTKLKARWLGLKAFEHVAGSLAKRLMITCKQLLSWLKPGSGSINGCRLRWYRDGKYKIVHRDDAEWLLENRERARRGDFDDHPGKLLEYD